MRIDRLDLIAYGHFTGKSLHLADGNAGLHLIYGDNEAGKTTTLRALIALLFGIKGRTRDNHLHATAQLRIGGRLRLSTGETQEFIRRKANKNTLLDFASEAPLDESALAPFVPRDIDEELFSRLYGINHERLLAGGQELLNQSGDLGQALFSAALGHAGFREILTGLRKSAEDLYTPAAHVKPVNRAIRSYREAQKQIKQASLSVAAWKGLRKEMADIVAAISQVEAQIDAKNRDKSRLERVNRVRGALAERSAVTTRLQEMTAVLLLSEDFDAECKAAADSLQKADEARKNAQLKLSRLQAEAAALEVRHELLENAESILAIHRDLGSVEKTIQDRPLQDGKRRQLRNEAAALLKGVRPDLGLDAADQLRTLLNNKRWIADLAQKHGLLNLSRKKAETALREIEDELETIGRHMAELPPTNLDLRELKAAIAEARKAGDLEERSAAARQRAMDEQAQCEAERARLGRFSGPLEALARAIMPLPETLDAFAARFDELAQRIRDDERRKKELIEEQRQAEQELQALLATGEAPTLAELEASRAIRNSGWGLIKRKYIHGLDVARELAKYAPDGDLPALYEQRVEAADHLADQVRLAADRVLKRADLEAQIEHRQRRLNDLAVDAAKAQAAGDNLREEWNAVWRPLQVDPGTPAEMREWLLRVEALLANARAANAAALEAKQLGERCEALQEAMALQIRKFDARADLSGMGLEARLQLCEQRVAQEEADLQRKKQLEQARHKALNRLARIREELRTIETEQATWRQDWGQAIAGLGLRDDAHPELATETFARLESFFAKFDESEELRRRIYGMDRHVEEFDARVFELAERLGLTRDGQDARVIAAQLNRDLTEAREARASLKKIRAQEKEAAVELEKAEISHQAALEKLALLRLQAGVKSDDELGPAAESSKKKRDLQRKLEALEQELNRAGDGLSIEQLENEAAASDADAIEGDLEKIAAELQELHAQRDALRDQRQKLRTELDARDGSSLAAQLSQQAEQHLADVVSGLEQHLRLRIAALMLEEKIEEYRRKNQAPLLARAGDLFSRLTLGSYANLRDELDDQGRPFLLGVRPDGKEVGVEGMSDGSRDQLYLSLRLATLEQHLGKGEPMPFVVDDILIGFDDDRTRVGLEVLAELAAITQVLLFTHHRRVIELADGIEAQAGVFIHELH
mgnify:CR=1 FL=1